MAYCSATIYKFIVMLIFLLYLLTKYIVLNVYKLYLIVYLQLLQSY